MKLPVGVPRPPRMGSGTPSNHLRGPVAPCCAHFPPAWCIRWPIWPPNGPQWGLRAPGWAQVGSGGRVLGRNPLGQRVGSLLLVFCPFLPRKRCHLAPKTALKWPRDMHHWGLVGVSWKIIHLGNVQAAFWSCFACFSPGNGVICLQSGPKWPQNGSKMGLEMSEIDFFPKKITLDHLGCSKTRLWAVWTPF